MMYEENEIQDFINKLDIVQVISEYVTLKKTGANYKGLSPFKPERTPSFTVSPTKNIFKDFSTGIGGNVISFYMKINDLSFPEAIQELSAKYNVPMSGSFTKNSESGQGRSLQKYYTVLGEALSFYSENIFKNKDALEYLDKRGLNENDVRGFKLGYASSNWEDLYKYLIDKEYSEEDLLELGLIKKSNNGNFFDTFRDRIIFPIYNKNQNIVGFGGRALDGNSTAKYLNSQESKVFNKSKEVYGLINRGEKIRKKGFVVLMEGYMDVLSAHKNDFENAVASLGTAFTEDQAKLLRKYTNNIIIAYDSDEAGRNALFRAAYILKRQEFNIKCLFFPSGIKDPDEFFQTNDKKKFIELLKESKDIFEYLFSEFSKDVNITSIEGKKIFIERFKEFFSNLENRIEIDIYLDKLSEELGISKKNLEEELLKKDKFKTNTKKSVKKEEITLKNKANYDLLEILTLKLILKFPKYYSQFANKEFKSFILMEILRKLKKIDFNTKMLDNSEIDEEERKLIFKLSREADLEIEIEEDYYKTIFSDWFKRELEKEIHQKKKNENYLLMKQIEHELKNIHNMKEINQLYNKFKLYVRGESDHV
ncbi:MAG: DNA primase [Sebaldella sp.]|nr:DNA primase [Sebaldella sp.]